MMFSLILRTAAKVLTPLMLLFSVFLLLRGHDESGGGFIGGLVIAGAFALYAVAYGTAQTREALRVDPRDLITAGLAFAVFAGLLPFFFGNQFLAGEWLMWDVGDGVEFKVGSSLIFDIGVYLIVAGMTLTVIFAIEERGKRLFPY
jgi:multicomponent Na+:H+ antiporter subunit B